MHEGLGSTSSGPLNLVLGHLSFSAAACVRRARSVLLCESGPTSSTLQWMVLIQASH